MLRRGLVLLIMAGSLSGCFLLQPGVDKPPIQVFPDMDNQPKYKAQAESRFFGDKRANRRPPAGTVAQGKLKEDDAFFTGKQNGQEVAVMPVKIDEALVRRGQERFNINCAPCHSRLGDGIGMVLMRQGGTVTLRPADLRQERLRTATDGYIFNVITNGKNTMQPLGQNIPEADRWAIVSYVRALQRTRSATVNDVPAEKRGDLK
ncbi:MAG TPA: cytochrome c [Blastocatellia bacterium]|nr:cytochrome c [Blastocatellia bacterium]